MTRSYPVLLLTFAALSGANFAFIRLAVDKVEPTTTGSSRLFLAALAILPFVLLRFGTGRRSELPSVGVNSRARTRRNRHGE